MDVKLVVIGGAHPGQEVPVQGPKFLIGRAEDCQIRPRSEMVSRHHCAILVEEGFVAVRDFGSKNGTFVNGEKVKSERELKAGDRLRIGPLEFEIQLSVSVSGKKKPKVHSVQEAAARTVESGSGEDADVSRWLGEAEETTPPAALQDTGSVHVAPPKPAAPREPDPATQTTLEPSPQAKTDQPQAMPGRPPGAKAAAASSRAAAAEMLKQFIKRRP